MVSERSCGRGADALDVVLCAARTAEGGNLMAHLVKYGLLSTTANGLTGNLVKAQCDICGRKFGSLEEARKCERNHLQCAITETLLKGGEK